MPDTRIDFAFGAPDKWRAACDTLTRHVKAGHSVIVYCTDPQVLQRFDLLLWGFEPTAFVPHVMADDPQAHLTPILLTQQALNPTQANKPDAWLLNLDADCPPMADTFSRVLEIVSHDEADTQAARARWRHYKNQGFKVVAHDLNRST